MMVVEQFDSGKASALLKDGKRVRRESWHADIRWVELSIDRSNPCRHVAQLFRVGSVGQKAFRGLWAITYPDFLACDWVEVAEPLTTPNP